LGLIFGSLAIFAVLWVLLTSSMLLVSRDWRWSLALLGMQYLGAFVLIMKQAPVEMALAKLLAGWIAVAVLAIALIGLPQNEDRSTSPSGRLFRLVAACIVILAVFSVASRLSEWVPGIGFEQGLGALILVGLGLLHLGLTIRPLEVVLGLLTILAGFEIIYSAVEVSALVTGLLAGVTLGMALIGAYLCMAPYLSESEPEAE
jgi:hypothetical protein